MFTNIQKNKNFKRRFLQSFLLTVTRNKNLKFQKLNFRNGSIPNFLKHRVQLETSLMSGERRQRNCTRKRKARASKYIRKISPCRGYLGAKGDLEKRRSLEHSPRSKFSRPFVWECRSCSIPRQSSPLSFLFARVYVLSSLPCASTHTCTHTYVCAECSRFRAPYELCFKFYVSEKRD